MNLLVMLTPKRIRIICIWQLRAVTGPLRPVHQVHLNRKLLWQRGLNFVPLHLSSGLPRRRYNPTSSKKYIARLSPLPYPMELLAKEAQQGQETTSRATTAIRWVTGPKSVPILRKVVIKVRVIKGKPMLRHARGMCIILRWRKFPWERLLPPVCFS